MAVEEEVPAVIVVSLVWMGTTSCERHELVMPYQKLVQPGDDVLVTHLTSVTTDPERQISDLDPTQGPLDLIDLCQSF